MSGLEVVQLGWLCLLTAALPEVYRRARAEARAASRVQTAINTVLRGRLEQLEETVALKANRRRRRKLPDVSAAVAGPDPAPALTPEGQALVDGEPTP